MTLTEPCLEAPPAGLLKGVAEFNRGEFFECHESLEELWLAEERPIRSLYQGILLGVYRPAELVSLSRWNPEIFAQTTDLQAMR